MIKEIFKKIFKKLSGNETIESLDQIPSTHRTTDVINKNYPPNRRLISKTSENRFRQGIPPSSPPPPRPQPNMISRWKPLWEGNQGNQGFIGNKGVQGTTGIYDASDDKIEIQRRDGRVDVFSKEELSDVRQKRKAMDQMLSMMDKKVDTDNIFTDKEMNEAIINDMCGNFLSDAVDVRDLNQDMLYKIDKETEDNFKKSLDDAFDIKGSDIKDGDIRDDKIYLD